MIKDKNAIMRLGIVMILIIIIFALLFFIKFSSSAVIDKKYYLSGEKVKLDLRDISNYKVKIITPSENILFRGNKNIELFKPKEKGYYKVIIEYSGKTEEISFNVVDSLPTGLPNITLNMSANQSNGGKNESLDA